MGLWPAWPGLAINWVLEGPNFRFIEAGKGGEMGIDLFQEVKPPGKAETFLYILSSSDKCVLN